MMLTQGYGVMDNPTIPIIAQNGGKPNDTYVEQLVAGAKAAIDKVVEMGVADRDHIGIGHLAGAIYNTAHNANFQAFKVRCSATDHLGGFLQVEKCAAAAWARNIFGFGYTGACGLQYAERAGSNNFCWDGWRLYPNTVAKAINQ